MKKCPVCSIPLTLVDYEGLRVMTCADCGGNLMKQDRLTAIERLDRTPTEQLRGDAGSFKGDTEAKIKCPGCWWPMRKQPLHRFVKQLDMDYCPRCGWVWLDGGELAIAQLAHQASGAFQDAQELKRRMEELESSPERKAAFDEAVSRLPEEENPIETAVREALEESLYNLVFRTPATLRGPGAGRR